MKREKRGSGRSRDKAGYYCCTTQHCNSVLWEQVEFTTSRCIWSAQAARLGNIKLFFIKHTTVTADIAGHRNLRLQQPQSAKSLSLAEIGVIVCLYNLGWYAQRRCTFTLGRNADFGRRAMLLNAENSGIPAATRV